MLVALVIVSLRMFVSGHAALLVAGIVIAAGVVAFLGARLIAGGIIRDVAAIRDGLMAVGRGERDVQIVTDARDELSQLAAAANVMIDDLATQAAARDQSDSARRNLVAADAGTGRSLGQRRMARH